MQSILDALKTLDSTVGLYSLEVRGYVITSIDAEYGGGFDLAPVDYQDDPLLHCATLEEVARFLAENPSE